MCIWKQLVLHVCILSSHSRLQFFYNPPCCRSRRNLNAVWAWTCAPAWTTAATTTTRTRGVSPRRADATRWRPAPSPAPGPPAATAPTWASTRRTTAAGAAPTCAGRAVCARARAVCAPPRWGSAPARPARRRPPTTGTGHPATHLQTEHHFQHGRGKILTFNYIEVYTMHIQYTYVHFIALNNVCYHISTYNTTKLFAYEHPVFVNFAFELLKLYELA